MIMTQLFESSSNTNYFLYSSTYLLLSLCKENTKEYEKPLFDNQLISDSNFTKMELLQKNRYSTTSFDTSTLPLFSLERTQSSVNTLSQSQSLNTGIFGTQTRDVAHHKNGQLRGTQEVSTYKCV
jgi:hypothetical protein